MAILLAHLRGPARARPRSVERVHGGGEHQLPLWHHAPGFPLSDSRGGKNIVQGVGLVVGVQGFPKVGVVENTNYHFDITPQVSLCQTAGGLKNRVGRRVSGWG